MKSIALIILGLVLMAGCKSASQSQKQSKSNYVVILSMDGFRWNYTKDVETPAFDSLANNGVKAEAIIPCFPSKTFPNHYTLATGLYPGEHGIVANSFYNSELKKKYSLSNRKAVTNADFYGGEPIWVTAEKNGLKAATCFWPGSEAAIKGVRPSYWVKYNGSLSYESRLDSVHNWLSLPYSQRPKLVMFYVEEPDMTGHKAGPDSEQLKTKIAELDKYLKSVRNRLAQLPIADSINFILLSDHGMTPIFRDKSYDLSSLIPEAWVAHQNTSNPVSLVDPAKGYADSICLAINKMEGLNAWKRAEIPEHLHFNNHPAIPEVVILADSSYHIYWKRDSYGSFGDHGYDPSTNSDMHTIFYASGPDFKENFTNQAFTNRAVNPLIKIVLGVNNSDEFKFIEDQNIKLFK